jgi:hypothetical protein
MSNPEHEDRVLRAIRTGDGSWNRWRAEQPGLQPDLRGLHLPRTGEGLSILGWDIRQFNFRAADLRDANLYRSWLVEADFTDADLRGAVLGDVTAGGAILERAKLAGANLMGAQFRFANFRGAWFVSEKPPNDYAETTEAPALPTRLIRADLWGAHLNGAHLAGIDLREANLRSADLTGADLSGADLRQAQLVDAMVEGANFHGCKVHALAAWNLRGIPKDEFNLCITPDDTPRVNADNLLSAQFLSVLADRVHISPALDSLTRKLVLILGSFSGERKPALDAVRGRLGELGWVPVLFDFDPLPRRNVTQTFEILASLAVFVVCDVTGAAEVRFELRHIAKELPAVPIKPLLLDGQPEWFGLKEERHHRHSILDTFHYRNKEHLVESLEAEVVASARSWLKSRDER